VCGRKKIPIIPKKRYQIKKWWETMAGAKQDKKVTTPNLHKSWKRWREQKKAKKRDYTEFKLLIVNVSI
jgi:hypothetical protein